MSNSSNEWVFKTTSVYARNLEAYMAKKRLMVNQGGTSSSKTFSIMQLLVLIAMCSATRLLISVVSESLPHLKRGCIRDLENIMGVAWDANAYNKTEQIYRFKNAQIEFFGADDASKLRGGRRDILYINECNNVSQPSFEELDVRTRICTFLDYNPVAEFWAHEIMASKGIHDFSRDATTQDCVFIKSTYQDAKHVLPLEVVKGIESRRDRDPNWWRVYGLGEIGNIEGLVHPIFAMCDALPEGGVRFFGLDFGFSNDPTSLIACVLKGDELYSDQLLYEPGLTNDQIAKRFEQHGIRKGYDEIFADSAEPKSIEEIKRLGYNVKPAPKGPDSVVAGIQRINQYKQYWTKRSIDAHKEQRNYRYIEDKDGRITNKPIDDYNHAMDARRYAVAGKVTTRGPMLVTSNRTVQS